MKNKSGWQEKSGILLGYVTLAVNFLIGIFYTPFMTRTLGQEEYGLYLQIGALIGYMSVADFGMHSTITRYVAKYRAEKNEEEQKQFLGNCLWFYTVVTVALLAVGVVLCSNIFVFLNKGTSPELFGKARIMSVFLLISFVFSLPMGMYISTLEGYGQFLITKGVKLLGLVIRIGLLIMMLKMSYGAIGIAFVDMCYTIAELIVFALVLRVKFGVRIRFVKFDWPKFKGIARYSIYIFILALVNQFYWKLGQVVLGKMISSESAAIYGLGTQLIGYITPITLTISAVFLPRITENVVKDQDHSKKNQILLEKVGKYQLLLIGLVFIGFVSLGRPFISLWVGDDYAITYQVTCLLIAAIIPQCILTIGTSLLKAMNLHRYQAIIYALSAALNVVIGVSLAWFVKEVGMAIGTFISIAAVQTPLMVHVLHKKADLNMKAFFVNLARSTTATFILAFGLIFGVSRLVPIQNWMEFIGLVLASCVIYLLTVYFLALDKDEKKTVDAVLSRIMKRKKRTNR